MKEKYVKPAMLIERFTLTSAVAKNCTDTGLGGRPTQSDFLTCKWEITPEFTLFTWEGGCTMPVEDGFNLGSGIVCYHNPVGNSIIFSS